MCRFASAGGGLWSGNIEAFVHAVKRLFLPKVFLSADQVVIRVRPTTPPPARFIMKRREYYSSRVRFRAQRPGGFSLIESGE